MLQTIFWFWFWKLVTARFFLLCLEIIIIISRNQTSLKIFKQEHFSPEHFSHESLFSGQQSTEIGWMDGSHGEQSKVNIANDY